MSLKNVFFGGKNIESFGRCNLFLALFYGKEAKLCEKWIQMIQIWQGVENRVLFVRLKDCWLSSEHTLQSALNHQCNDKCAPSGQAKSV